MNASKDKFKNIVTYPVTLSNLLDSVCDDMGIELATEEFPNNNYTILNNPFTNNESNAIVISSICQLAGGFAYIGRDDRLYIKNLELNSKVERIDPTVFFDDFVMEDYFSAINTVVVALPDVEGENVTKGEDIHASIIEIKGNVDNYETFTGNCVLNISNKKNIELDLGNIELISSLDKFQVDLSEGKIYKKKIEDKLYYENNEWFLNKEFGSTLFTGNENWVIHTYEGYYEYELEINNVSNISTNIWVKEIPTKINDIDTDNFIYIKDGKIIVTSETLLNIEEFKNFIKDKKAYYVLNEATIVDVKTIDNTLYSQLLKLNQLSLEDGKNTITLTSQNSVKATITLNYFGNTGKKKITGDIISLDDVVSIKSKEIQIKENYLITSDEDRKKVINELFNTLNGIHYLPFSTSYYGFPYLDIGDNIEVFDKKGNSYNSYVFNLSFKYNGAFSGKIETPNINETIEKIKNASDLKTKFRNVELSVDKINGVINSIVNEVEGQNQKISEIEQTSEKIEQTVTNIVDLTREASGTTLKLENCMEGNLLELQIDGNNTVFKDAFEQVPTIEKVQLETSSSDGHYPFSTTNSDTEIIQQGIGYDETLKYYDFDYIELEPNTTYDIDWPIVDSIINNYLETTFIVEFYDKNPFELKESIYAKDFFIMKEHNESSIITSKTFSTGNEKEYLVIYKTAPVYYTVNKHYIKDVSKSTILVHSDNLKEKFQKKFGYRYLSLRADEYDSINRIVKKYQGYAKKGNNNNRYYVLELEYGKTYDVILDKNEINEEKWLYLETFENNPFENDIEDSIDAIGYYGLREYLYENGDSNWKMNVEKNHIKITPTEKEKYLIFYCYTASTFETAKIYDNYRIIDLEIKEELKEKEGTKDDYINENGEAKVVKRIGVDENSENYILSKEEIKSLGTKLIPLKEGNNYIELENYTANMHAKYIISNEFTKHFTTTAELYSTITQLANQINLVVSKKVGTDEIFARINMAVLGIDDAEIPEDIEKSIIEILANKIAIKSDNFELTKEGVIKAIEGLIAGLKMTTNDNGDSYLYKNYKVGNKTYQSGLFIPKEGSGTEAFLYAGVDVTNGSAYLRDANTVITHDGKIYLKTTSGSSNNKNGLSGGYIKITDSTADVETVIGSSLIDTYYVIAGDGGKKGYCMHGYDTSHSYWCNWTGSWFTFYADGVLVANATTRSSDERLKEEIGYVPDKLIELVDSLEIKKFKIKNMDNIRFGIIAQDLLKKAQELKIDNIFDYQIIDKQKVHLEDETLYYLIDYEQFLILKNKSLENKLKKQQNTIDFLINKMNLDKELKEYLKGEQ